MLDLILVRHGESEANTAPGIISGLAHDSPLTPLGERQAAALGKRLRDREEPFTDVITSPTVRTQETCRIALEAMGSELEPVIEERIQELTHGEWEGRKRADHMTEDWYRRFVAGEDQAPGGETILEAQERVTAWAHELAETAREKDRRVLVFSHGHALRALFRGLWDFPVERTFQMVMENTGITHLRFHKWQGKWEWLLIRYNDSGHLELLE